ncbi:MAG: N-acetylmuramoyl-L-alanine amidase [Bacteroidaceae bacterium]
MGIKRCFIKLNFIFLLCLTMGFSVVSESNAKNFVLVIDPGHGGKDPGAMAFRMKEKDINLKVALQLGNLIKRNMKDVDIIYTRDKDFFVTLKGRAQMANDAHADLFLSIHTNSVASKRQPSGASTWTLGLYRSKDNLEVAQRENGVILYEKDYKTQYHGFDPNSPDSYIIFEFMQDQNMAQSVHFADLIQQQFKTYCGRYDRGVRQSGFLVLREVGMPSVLVELGFISNSTEVTYLKSSKGQYSLASAIYRAFKSYKEEEEKRIESTKINGDHAQNIVSSVSTPIEKNSLLIKEKTIFKVQIVSSDRIMSASNRLFKGLLHVGYYKSGIYRYTCGDSENYDAVNRLRRSLSKRFPGCFVIAVQGDNRVDIHAAIKQYRNK